MEIEVRAASEDEWRKLLQLQGAREYVTRTGELLRYVKLSPLFKG